VIVADTDVLIDAFDKERELMRRRVLELAESGELATTAITLYELTAGPRTTSAQLEVLHAALGPLVVLPVTRGAADVAAAGADRRALRSLGGLGTRRLQAAGLRLRGRE
jgi:predicted nucleic acid-binding protein